MSSAGGGRFVVPALAAVVLASMLGALEITKRPRRAAGPISGSANAMLVIGVGASLGALALASPTSALASPRSAQGVDVGELRFLDAEGTSLEGGGSATEFTVALSGAAQCPGDSANDGYFVFSYMVPAGAAAEDITFNGIGPVPQVYERYDDFQMPLFDLVTTGYVGAATAEQDVPGGPGAIVNIPSFSFAVYRQGEMPLGAYRVGLACVFFGAGEVRRYWDNEIVVTADDSDPAGFKWRVVGDPSPGGRSLWPAPASVGIAIAAGCAVLFVRRRLTRSPAPSSRELP